MSYGKVIAYKTNLFNKDGSYKLTIKTTYVRDEKNLSREKELAAAKEEANQSKKDYESANKERLARWGETVKVESVKAKQ